MTSHPTCKVCRIDAAGWTPPDEGGRRWSADLEQVQGNWLCRLCRGAHPFTDEALWPRFDRIYTVGYAKWTPGQLEEWLEETGAILIDVRMKPRTGKPGFGKEQLAEQLGARRYGHLEAFGNSNYKGGVIKLNDPELGLAYLRALHQRGRVPIALLCGCRHVEQCHRSDVAQLISKRLGGHVEHVQSPAEKASPELFD